MPVEEKKQYGARKGSFGYLCLCYYASATFKNLDPATQLWHHRALDLICEKHGDNVVDDLKDKHIRKLRDELVRAASKKRLKALKALFSWAVDAEEASHNPTIGVRPIKYPEIGIPTWSEEEITQYEKHHEIGTSARLAMALMLYTACRLEDAIRFGPQHFRNGRVQFAQAKNEHRRDPVSIDIKIHRDLRAIIDATPLPHLVQANGQPASFGRFLVVRNARPFTPRLFGKRFKDWCRQANLPHCSSHGLRKAAARRLAEVGCTTHEIMSYTGHKSLKEVERYTKEARKAKLADAAMAKLKG